MKPLEQLDELLPTNLVVCSRCIYDERMPSISFDEAGVCNFCKQIDDMMVEYATGTPRAEARFMATVDTIRRRGKGKRYDCVIGVSGGVDSSYMLYLAKQWGLRPLAVHYDNTWNSAIATQNIHKVLRALDVDLYTWVVDNKEIDDIYRAFFLAGVPDIDASTDLALAETMYRAAAKFGISYVLDGHSFVAEGIAPSGKNYFDGKYVRSIHRQFGRRPMRTYPLMTFARFMKSALISRIHRIRPFWYVGYDKDEARAFLEREYGWEYYGGHHLENRMTAFYHTTYAPEKFNYDGRNLTLAALVRNGKISRQEAWARYTQPLHAEEDLVGYFCKRLGFSREEFDRIMAAPPRGWWEFPTYKKRFERLRPLFAMLAKAELVPMSFYLKYCFPAKASW